MSVSDHVHSGEARQDIGVSRATHKQVSVLNLGSGWASEYKFEQ